MLSQSLSRIGGSAARHPWRVIATWLLVAAATMGAAGTVGGDLTDRMRAPGLDSQAAADLLGRANGEIEGQAGITAQVVLTPVDDAATFFGSDPASARARAAAGAVRQRLSTLPDVLGTNDLAAEAAAGPGAATAEGAVSPDGRVAVLRLQYPGTEDLAPAALEELEAALDELRVGSPLRLEAGGGLYFAYASPPANVGELLGLLFAAAILFLAFGSVVAAALPIGMAALGLAVGTGAITLLAGIVEMPTFAPVLGSMVGIGVGIDYALFILARHREYLARGLEVPTAAARAVATAGRPVVFAGGVVIVSVLGMVVAGVPFITAGGFGVSIVVLVMVVASVTLLPAFLGVAGHRIDRFGPRRLVAAQGAGEGAGARVWRPWIRHVNRHPVVHAAGAAALLLALAAPVLALRVGIPDDGTLPGSRTERRAYDLVAEGFGPGVNGPLVIAVDPHGDAGVLPRLAGAVAADPGVAGVSAARVDDVTGIASLLAFPTTGPQDEATTDTVARLRADVLPAVLAGSPAEAHIGGAMPNFADVGLRVSQRLPWFVAAVLAMSFVLLVPVFRSVVVPLKAVLLNLLSIGASYGVMVMVFQWGWAAGLIGLEATVPIVSFIPLFMFAILFGLSMDYEVFLVSRVREEYLRTVAAGRPDNGEAIVRGISGTARVITSAALIMIAVFSAFVFGQDAATKMFGIGLATAILVDATVVRMVLVPATMTLLGRANWWLPGWLERVLPPSARSLDHNGEVRRPTTTPGFPVRDGSPVG